MNMVLEATNYIYSNNRKKMFGQGQEKSELKTVQRGVRQKGQGPVLGPFLLFIFAIPYLDCIMIVHQC